MKLTPEDLTALGPVIEKLVEKRMKDLSQKIEILQADIRALRVVTHKYDSE
jgi:hypothetical protein